MTDNNGRMPRTVDFMRNIALRVVEKHSNYVIIFNCIWAPQKGADMGKDRNGKELGKGLSQRTGKFKNGKEDRRYVASFYGKDGKRVSRTFNSLKDAKQWRYDSQYEDRHYLRINSETITVNEWYSKWISAKEGTVRDNTIRNNRERYEHNVRYTIGRMRMVDVKPVHCQEVLKQMADDGYKGSTIKQTLTTMYSMFATAVENDIIRKNPITKSGVRLPKEVIKNIKFFTIDEQRKFISVAKDYAYYPQFRMVLETGLRTGELIGLKWSRVDLQKRELRVEETLEYRYSTQEWKWGPPKTKKGYRTIKLTDKAVEILQQIKDSPSNVNEKTPDEFKDLVFINRTGFPTKNSTYDAALTKRCDDAKVKRLSMHGLRHTFATRFCEISTNYKYLSETLGHSSIKITLDVYVHPTEESIEAETEKYSAYTKSLNFD